MVAVLALAIPTEPRVKVGWPYAGLPLQNLESRVAYL